jgi:hypothetical protein
MYPGAHTAGFRIDRMGIMEICKLIFQTNKNPGSLVREGMPGELFCGGGSREQAHLGNHETLARKNFVNF